MQPVPDKWAKPTLFTIHFYHLHRLPMPMDKVFEKKEKKVDPTTEAKAEEKKGKNKKDKR